MLIPFSSIIDQSQLIGSSLGRVAFSRLSEIVYANPLERIFALSAKDIQATDTTFARESVLALAKINRGTKAFCLVDISDRDQLDNWSYAADAQGQPLMAWNGKEHSILGAQLTMMGTKIVAYALECGTVSVSQVSTRFEITVPNASTTLKRLRDQGYLMRTEAVCPSGGIEYFYHSISPCE